MRHLAWLVLLACAGAHAHRSGDSFLTLAVEGERHLAGQWEIALRDLDALAALDEDRDGALTWGELRRSEPRVADLLRTRLSVAADGAACTLRLGPLQLNDRADGRFAWLALAGTCPAAPRELEIGYRLLFDVDASHRGFLALRAQGHVHTAVFAPERQSARIQPARPAHGAPFLAYLREGVVHVWAGIDHVLFLLCLLLPSVLVRVPGGWRAAPDLRRALRDVAGIVTAFTLAHSVTLSLGALGVLRVNSMLVESAIAVSVVLAALNNLRPMVTRRRWALALGFGLVHGLGFASVLQEIGLPPGLRALALAGFNIGVELGQLAIVVVFVPLAWQLRTTMFYARVVCAGGSCAMALAGAAWAVLRTGLAPG